MWHAFVAEYTSGGDAKLRSRDAAFLDQLAFCPDGATQLAAEIGSPEGIRANLRLGIENIALALSQQSLTPHWRPLHKAVIAGLADRWTTLRQMHGLYPPPPVALSMGVTDPAREQRTESYNALLRTPEGGVLAGTLTLLHTSYLRAEAQRVCHRLHRSDHESREVVYAIAQDYMRRILRAYDPQLGPSLPGFVYRAMRRGLLALACAYFSEKHGQSKPGTIDAGVVCDLADARASLPLSALESKDAEEVVRRTLPQLPDCERQVLLLRFGLADGHQHTYEEIAANIGGYTRQGVHQIERRALRHLEVLLARRGVTLASEGDIHR